MPAKRKKYFTIHDVFSDIANDKEMSQREMARKLKVSPSQAYYLMNETGRSAGLRTVLKNLKKLGSDMVVRYDGREYLLK